MVPLQGRRPGSTTARPRTSPPGRCSPPATRRPSRSTTRRARATVRRRGQHVVIARFLDRVVPRPAHAAAGRHAGRSRRSEPRANFIDDEVLETLTVLRLPVSPPADDATFLRRVRLDLTGTLPTPRRGRGVPRTTARPTSGRSWSIGCSQSDEFVDYWTLPVRDAAPHPLAAEREGGRGGVPRLAARAGPQGHAARRGGARAADGGRRLARGRPGELRPRRRRRPRAGRARQPGVPRRPAPVRQLPQPPARPLDAGRLPRPGRGVRPPRPRPARSRSPLAGRSPTRAPASRPCRASRACATSTRTSDGREAFADWLTAPDNPLLRPGGGQPAVAGDVRPRPGRAGRRPARHQPGDAPRAARPPRRRLRRSTATTSGTRSG